MACSSVLVLLSHTAYIEFFSCVFFVLLHLRDEPLFFYWGGGGGGGVTIFGTCGQFFSKSDAFQTIFFITFVMETIFLQPFLKKVTGFFIDLI